MLLLLEDKTFQTSILHTFTFNSAHYIFHQYCTKYAILHTKIGPVSLVDDVTLTVYKVMIFNLRLLLMRTLDRSAETLGRECNLCVVISFTKQNQSSTYYVGIYTWLRYCHEFQFDTYMEEVISLVSE